MQDINDALARLGWDEQWAREFRQLARTRAVPARVARLDRGFATLLTGDAALRAATAGRVPAVGDWLAVEGDAIVGTLPRRSLLRRKAAGEGSVEQVVAANLDVVAVVLALDAPLRPRKLERMLAVAWSSGARPGVVLTKCDLDVDAATSVAQARAVAGAVDVLAVSAVSGDGMDAVRGLTPPGETLGLIGPSGVGKSTLVNTLLGTERAQTAEVRADGRGRHTTTHRELVLVPGGGMVIDTPGMRALGVWEAGEGIGRAFADIEELARGCRFRNCGHGAEPGCAVQSAIRLHPGLAERVQSWRKLGREQATLDARQDARALAAARQQSRRRRSATETPPED